MDGVGASTVRFVSCSSLRLNYSSSVDGVDGADGADGVDDLLTGFKWIWSSPSLLLFITEITAS